MKRAISILAALVIMFNMAAQPPRQQQQRGGDNTGRQAFSYDEFKKHMEGFIAFRAGLTPEESAKFFPLLHEMFKAQRELDHKQRMKMQKPHELTEDEAKKIILETIELENLRRKIEETYYTKRFPKVISWKKILKVRTAVEAFKMEALKKFAPNPAQRRGGPRPDGNRPK